MNTDPDPDPPRAAASRVASLLLPLCPLVALGIVGYINSLGVWPAFRQQDTSVLHWILASNPRVLRGLSQERKSEGFDPLKYLMNSLRDYLTLENMNLSGLDLSSSDLGDMTIENVNLAGARLVNANFSCTDLTNVNFSGTRLMQSRFDYSECRDHISTRRHHCSHEDLDQVNKYTIWPYGRPSKITCLEGRFVGADFSDAQIRGDRGRRSMDYERLYCNKLLVLVGDMSGANFDGAKLTCVALIHRPVSTAAVPNTFNGISFADARLDRVALLKGPFKFTKFERANLMGLFLNINANQVDLDYSRFNEIQCNAPATETTSESSATHKDWPCLLVQQDKRYAPLRLNLLWSTVVTNLKPSHKDDKFICTPKKDLPSWVEKDAIESAGYWLLPTRWPNAEPILLDCPGNSKESKGSKRPEQSHVLSPEKSGDISHKLLELTGENLIWTFLMLLAS